MSWIRGFVSGEVSQGSIIGRTDNLEVMYTPKPVDPNAAKKEGLDVDLLDFLYKKRKPGQFKCMAHFGAATAILVPWDAITKPDELCMGRLLEKYFGYMSACGTKPAFPGWVAVMNVRNTGAPARQNDAEPFGGMAHSLNLLADQVGEMVEMGVYRDGGWTHFLLPKILADYQSKLYNEQEMTWKIVKPGFCKSNEARIELMNVGSDELDGRCGIVTVGPVGDVSIISVAKLCLEGTNWKFCDLEIHNNKPMNRHTVAIAPRIGRSPVVFQLNQGKLDDFGHHFVLDGENRELAVTHVGRAVLEALGWLL